jgi:hypothetical protein
MIPKFKDTLLFRNHLLEAAKKRVLDAPYVKYSNKELQEYSVQVIREINSLLPSVIKENLPINSSSEREFLKNFKYFTYLMNSKIISLEEIMENDYLESTGNIKEIQRELIALDTEVEEKEMELLGNYSEVHLNTFSRTKDSQLQYSDSSWLVDFKTGVTYKEELLMNRIGPGSLTNPLSSYINVPIKDAVIIDELSDTGDSVSPIEVSNPRNLYLKNKIFRYVVARKEYDSSGRKYKTKTSLESYPYSCVSTLTVQLELPNLMQINTLKINPLGDSTVFIKDLRYINESGQEVSLNSVDINTQTDIVILFESILTKFLIIQFEQKAHVERTELISEDLRVSAINNKLANKGFTNRLPEIKEKIQGRVYDFSIENVEVGLSIYETRGIFRSLPVKVSSPIGMEVQKLSESIVPTTSLEKDYFGSYSVLAEGASLIESYVGVRLWDKQENKKVDALVPVLDSNLAQREILSPINQEAKFKLFPELKYVNNLKCIEDIKVLKVCREDLPYYGASGRSTVTTESVTEGTFRRRGSIITEVPSDAGCTIVSVFSIQTNEKHNLTEGDSFKTFSSEEEVSGIEFFVFKVIDEYTFYTRVDAGVITYWLGTEDKELCINAAVNIDSIKVYENNSILTYGRDYLISVDDGSTWRSAPFTALEIEQLVKPRAAAGKFFIKLLNYNSANYYWTEYIVERNQYLTDCKNIRLKNGRVVFNKNLKDSSGTLQVILVSRTSSNNVYLTNVIREYSLAIQNRNIENTPSGKVMKASVKRRIAAGSNSN